MLASLQQINLIFEGCRAANPAPDCSGIDRDGYMWTNLDKWLFCYLLHWSREWGLTSLAKRVSRSGDGPIYLGLGVSLLVFHPQGAGFFNQLLWGFAIELPLYLGLKHSLRRPRPCHALLELKFSFEPADKFSLPSGHTAAAFMVASFIAVTFPFLNPWVFIWASAIGWSRIALGVHYPLDIIAGMALGLGSASVVLCWL
jgi:undecaprenyl-diphosphatase